MVSTDNKGHLVLVGGGSAQALLMLPRIPELGDTIRVKRDQIVLAATDNAYLMVGSTYTVLEISTTEVGERKIPWVTKIEVVEE